MSGPTGLDGSLQTPLFSGRSLGIHAMRQHVWCAIDYKAGKETGQAAWDEQGKLLCARGTASDAR